MKTNTKKNTPELRFPEFDGEWKKNEIKKYVDFLTGYAFKSDDISEFPTNDFILKATNIGEGRIKRNIDSDRFYSGVKEIEQKYRLSKNDLVIGMDGSKVGRNSGLITENEKNSLLIQRVARLRAKEDFPIRFIFSHINSIRFHKYVDKVKTSSGIPHISSSDIKNFKIFFPSLPEQQKIANFLSQVDQKIDLLSQKVEQLALYKKGVMQKIFSQEIRFKDNDGKEFPEWVFKKGSKLFASISDKNHNSELPILAVTQDQGAIPRDMIEYNIGVTPKSISSYKVVEKGDFIISLRSFQGGIEYSNYKGICSPAYLILRSKKDIISAFYKNYFKTYKYIIELNKKLEGIRDGKMISYKYFSEIDLPYPSIKEQTKIANFLSAIDRKIESAHHQLEQTQEFKKGLLQKMFV